MPLRRARVLGVLLLALAAAPAWGHGLRVPEPPIGQAAAVLAPAAPASPPNSPARIERAPHRVRADRSGVGAVDVIAVLIVALGLAGLGWSWRPDRRAALAAATAGLALGFVIETTPHLVHHSLDADQGAGCEALQTVERSQATVGALDVVPVPAPTDLIDAPSFAPAPTLASPAPRGRAPPA